MRAAPQSIVEQQARYALGVRLWTCLNIIPHFAILGWMITNLMDPRLVNRSLKLVVAFVILVTVAIMVRLNPRGQAARCRKASDLLGGEIIRYEVGDTVSDSDLAEVAEQAAQMMRAPLPALTAGGEPYWPGKRR